MTKNPSVAFKFDYGQTESGGAWNAVGASTPTNFSAGDTFTFNFQNQTSGVTFTYDISCFNFDLISGSSSGAVPPGQTVAVTIYRGSPGDGDGQAANTYSLQAGAAPLITLPNGTVCFWFFTDENALDDQQIEICNNDQSSFPITSTPTQTTEQMNCISSTANIGIGRGGGGGNLTSHSTSGQPNEILACDSPRIRLWSEYFEFFYNDALNQMQGLQSVREVFLSHNFLIFYRWRIPVMTSKLH